MNYRPTQLRHKAGCPRPGSRSSLFLVWIVERCTGCRELAFRKAPRGNR